MSEEPTENESTIVTEEDVNVEDYAMAMMEDDTSDSDQYWTTTSEDVSKNQAGEQFVTDFESSCRMRSKESVETSMFGAKECRAVPKKRFHAQLSVDLQEEDKVVYDKKAKHDDGKMDVNVEAFVFKKPLPPLNPKLITKSLPTSATEDASANQSKDIPTASTSASALKPQKCSKEEMLAKIQELEVEKFMNWIADNVVDPNVDVRLLIMVLGRSFTIRVLETKIAEFKANEDMLQKNTVSQLYFQLLEVFKKVARQEFATVQMKYLYMLEILDNIKI